MPPLSLPPAVYFWDRHPSLYEQIKANLRPDGLGLIDPSTRLIDEDQVIARNPARWAAGGADGVFAHHVRARSAEAPAGIVEAIAVYCGDPSAASKQAVYEQAVTPRVVEYVNPLLRSVAENAGLSPARVHELAQSLATQAGDREPVKLGIALMGLFQRDEDQIVFKELGQHEEFTLFCAAALRQTSLHAEEDLWRLARQVHGWGRIAAVERLAGAEDPNIKDWLLREGYKNTISNGYLSLVCAKAGELLPAMEQREVDAELLHAAGELIEALLAGGPVYSMTDYDDGADVVERYLAVVAERVPLAPEHRAVVEQIEKWLTDSKAPWHIRADAGWTGERRARLLADARRVLGT